MKRVGPNMQVDPEVLHVVQTTNSHQYIQLPASSSMSSSSGNAAVEVPPQLRDIVAWSHMTLPYSSGALTVNGVAPKGVIVDTGTNYVMIGKKLAEHMELTDADLFEESHTTQLGARVTKVEGSLSAKWQSFFGKDKQTRPRCSFM